MDCAGDGQLKTLEEMGGLILANACGECKPLLCSSFLKLTTIQAPVSDNGIGRCSCVHGMNIPFANLII